MDKTSRRPDNSLLGIAYLRKSRDPRERADPQLLAHHRALLLRLAAEDGVPLTEEWIFSEVRSGEHLAARPEFQRLLAALGALPPGAAPVLYCVDVDRLGRGVATERGLIQDALRAAGVTIRTPAGVIHLDNPDETLLYEVKGSLARHELARYKERVELKRVEQVRTGQIRTGRPPWGYVWDRSQPGRGVPRPHPERFPILCAICQEVRHTSVKRLAKRYGIPNATLLWTLQNPAIAGYPARRYRADLPGRTRHTRPLPRELWIWPDQPADYAAACTRDEWEAIQEILAERTSRRAKTGFDENGWARDVIRFLDRPGPVRLASISEGRLFYEQFTAGAPRCFAPRGEVHAIVYQAMVRFFADPEAVREGLKNRTEAAVTGADDTDLLNERRRLRDALDRLTEERAMLDEPEARDANLRVQQRLEQRLRQANGQIARAAEARVAAKGDEFSDAYLLEIRVDFPVIWQGLGGSVKRALVNQIIAALPIRVEKPEDAKRYLREYLPVVYRPWVPPLEK